MAKIKQFEAFTNIFVAYKKNWVYIHNQYLEQTEPFIGHWS